MSQPKIYALILAGGKSSRMGEDKALISYNGKTLLEHAVSYWSQFDFIEKIIVSEGYAGHFPSIEREVVTVSDIYEGKGPMSGILSAFVKTDADILYVSAVDMPNLDEGLVLPIPLDADAAVYMNDGRPEPLYGVYKRSVADTAKKLLKSDNCKMRLLLENVKTAYFTLPNSHSRFFLNINTREDLYDLYAGNPPMIAVTGWSGSGKTTFMEKLIAELIHRGYSVGSLKHDAHGFEMDREGKDTWRFNKAGALNVGIIGPEKWALLGKGDFSPEQMRKIMPKTDIILVEGYKLSHLPKIEIHRKATGKDIICHDKSLIALATDEPVQTNATTISLEDTEKCADIICRNFLDR